jgi:hypothetical protein
MRSTGPQPPLTYQIGRVTALIDERARRSSYFPDSRVGFYDTVTARLQIIGQEVRPQGIWRTMLLVIPNGTPRPAQAGLCDLASACSLCGVVRWH